MDKTHVQQSSAKASGSQSTHAAKAHSNKKPTAHEVPARNPSNWLFTSGNLSPIQLLHLQHTLGNRAVGRLIQAKLTISHPGDPYEREADRVADAVMRMPEPAQPGEEETPVQTQPLATQITPLVQREPVQPIEEEKEESVATKPLIQRVPVAVREDDEEEETVAPKLEPGAELQEEEPEKAVQAKLEIGADIQRQAKEDEEKKEETLESPSPIQRQMGQEDEEAVQTKPLSGSLSQIPSISLATKLANSSVQRLCAECEEELAQTKPIDNRLFAGRQVRAQRKEGAALAPQVTPSVSANIRALQGGGSPLPQATRAFFEPRFGADFSQVRVHTGARAADTAKSINAKAFTVGQDIAFGAGQYAPESHEGRRLLAHELTHVVQQDGAARRAPSVQRKAEAPGGSDKVIAPSSLGISSTHGAPQLQPAWYNFDIPFTDYQFDPSLEGIKTAAGIVKDAAVAGLEWIVDQIKGLVSSGIASLSAQWESIKAFAASAFESAKKAFANIIGFIRNPLGFLADAIMSMDAQAVARSWATFSKLVSTVADGFKVLTGNLLQQVNRIWGGISGFATSLLNKLAGLTQGFLFKKLPDALQKVAFSVVDGLKRLWKTINDGFTTILNKIKTWVEGALDTVFGFVRKVLSFGINVVIAGIITFGKIVLFLKDFFANPQKYLAILAQRAVQAFGGLETRFAGIVGQYFGGAKTSAALSAAPPLKVQREPETTATAPETKRTATWSEIGNGVLDLMGKKWGEFKANPLQFVITLLLDLYLPIAGNVKDIIQLFKDIKKAVSAPLSAGSLQELWTSLLLILEIPRLIAHTVVGILMRTLMLPLIVASFIPEPIVQTIATVVGYALLGLFLQVETMNLAHKLLLLKTGLTVKSQRDDACNSIADSLIALIMAGAMVLIVLLLKFIASVARGIINFIKGKFFTPEIKPVETKGPSAGEGKGGAGEGKGSKAGEAPKLEGEVPSRDGQRSIKVTEKGKIWICASPCQEIRLKYEAQIKDNQALNERIKALEEGYADLPPEQKSVRDAQIKQLEQELADLKLAQEGGVRAPKEVKWPPEPPKGDKPPVTAPDAAEWRYQRYVYEKFQEGAKPKDVLPPDEWMRRYFDPTAEGGRPGRPGGPEQVAAKQALAGEGIRIVENVELGGRFPDGVDPKPNAKGGTSYFEVGKMLEGGIPEARERVKIADEIKAMGPKDTVTFVDKSDVSKRVTYEKGSTPENPTSRTFEP